MFFPSHELQNFLRDLSGMDADHLTGTLFASAREDSVIDGGSGPRTLSTRCRATAPVVARHPANCGVRLRVIGHAVAGVAGDACATDPHGGVPGKLRFEDFAPTGGNTMDAYVLGRTTEICRPSCSRGGRQPGSRCAARRPDHNAFYAIEARTRPRSMAT